MYCEVDDGVTFQTRDWGHQPDYHGEDLTC